MSNILIDVDTGEAFLNDWDLCKFVSELGVDANPSQYGRSVSSLPVARLVDLMTHLWIAGNLAVYVRNSFGVSEET